MKNILACVIVAATFGMTACNNQPQKNDTKSENNVEAKSVDAQKIAFVEVDTIMSQYKYWKDVTKLMQTKQANVEKTLSSKQKALQQAAANFQQNLQQNKFKSQQEAQAVQNSLQKQAQDGDALQQRLASELQEEAAKYNQALADSIHHYLAVYNKNKKYSLILSKQGDNILYGDKALDITNEIVAGLNKAYKGMK